MYSDMAPESDLIAPLEGHYAFNGPQGWNPKTKLTVPVSYDNLWDALAQGAP